MYVSFYYVGIDESPRTVTLTGEDGVFEDPSFSAHSPTHRDIVLVARVLATTNKTPDLAPAPAKLADL